jgi:hypothetical protein
MSDAWAQVAATWNGYTPQALPQARKLNTLEPPHDPEA